MSAGLRGQGGPGCWGPWIAGKSEKKSCYLAPPSPPFSPATTFCCFSESTLFCDVQLVCGQAKCGRERGGKGGGETEGREVVVWHTWFSSCILNMTWQGPSQDGELAGGDDRNCGEALFLSVALELPYSRKALNPLGQQLCAAPRNALPIWGGSAPAPCSPTPAWAQFPRPVSSARSVTWCPRL